MSDPSGGRTCRHHCRVTVLVLGCDSCTFATSTYMIGTCRNHQKILQVICTMITILKSNSAYNSWSGCATVCSKMCVSDLFLKSHVCEWPSPDINTSNIYSTSVWPLWSRISTASSRACAAATCNSILENPNSPGLWLVCWLISWFFKADKKNTIRSVNFCGIWLALTGCSVARCLWILWVLRMQRGVAMQIWLRQVSPQIQQLLQQWGFKW